MKTLRLEAASRLKARNPLGASATRVPLTRATTKLPMRCKSFFTGEKCSTVAIGLAHHDFGASIEDRLNQRRDVSRVVLVVGVGVDDDVGAVFEARTDSKHEGSRQTLIPGEADHMRDSELARYRDTAALIDGSDEARLAEFRVLVGEVTGGTGGTRSDWVATRDLSPSTTDGR